MTERNTRGPAAPQTPEKIWDGLAAAEQEGLLAVLTRSVYEGIEWPVADALEYDTSGPLITPAYRGLDWAPDDRYYITDLGRAVAEHGREVARG